MKANVFAVLAVGCLGPSTYAASITGPLLYTSAADTPQGFFTHDNESLVCLQDFEDPRGNWQDGFSIDVGRRIGPNAVSGDGVPVTDSVDLDDGSLDGDGRLGSSWFSDRRNLMITFDVPTLAAGFVFTDTDTEATKITITAFDPAGQLLVQGEYDNFADEVFTGTTGDDRFFGISTASGESVKRVRVEIDAGMGIEIDHLQFVKPIPEPTGTTLLGIACVSLVVGSRRRTRCSR